MTNRTLPPLNESDAYDVRREVVEMIEADPRISHAKSYANTLLLSTNVEEWRPFVFVTCGLACFLDHDEIRELVGTFPGERIIPLQPIAEAVVAARLASDELDELGDLYDLKPVVGVSTRMIGFALGMAAFVVMMVLATFVAVLTARPAGAASVSCSLSIEAHDASGITWRYRPDDGVTRGLFVGQRWYELRPGGTARTPNVETIDYPSRGDTLAVAEVLEACGDPNPPSTTTTPATTSTTAMPTTTSTTTSSTVAPSTTTTEQATTTTAKARPAIVCPANTWLQLTTTAPGDNLWTMTALIGGQPTEVFATEPVWISTWTFVRPTQVEVDAPVAADCIPAVPVGPPVTEPAPVLTTLATTPASDLTPATIPTTASSDPAPTTVPQVVVGGELPRTGPGYVLLTIGLGLLLLAAGGIAQLGRRS